LTVLTAAGVVYLLQRTKRQHEEQLSLLRDLEVARSEGAQWRSDMREVLKGLGSAIDAQFERWQLTPAEREVAMLMLKGLSHKEIAAVREASERTVRQQARAIYGKANLSGRAALSAFFLEDLLLPGGAAYRPVIPSARSARHFFAARAAKRSARSRPRRRPSSAPPPAPTSSSRRGPCASGCRSLKASPPRRGLGGERGVGARVGDAVDRERELHGATCSPCPEEAARGHALSGAGRRRGARPARHSPVIVPHPTGGPDPYSSSTRGSRPRPDIRSGDRRSS
jgi:DNA-binding CsgD family transcriptional regulator